jgi:hypothetical protein
MCEETLKASFTDGMKAVYRLFSKPDNKYGIVYEDGSISRTWR